MNELPDFELITSFTENQVDALTKITKTINFNKPNNGIIAIGAVTGMPKWQRVGYVIPAYDYLITGDRLTGTGRLLTQSNSFSEFKTFKFDFPLIGFQLVCLPWITTVSCEVYLGKI